MPSLWFRERGVETVCIVDLELCWTAGQLLSWPPRHVILASLCELLHAHRLQLLSVVNTLLLRRRREHLRSIQPWPLESPELRHRRPW